MSKAKYILRAAIFNGRKKFLFLSSDCVHKYPFDAMNLFSEKLKKIIGRNMISLG